MTERINWQQFTKGMRGKRNEQRSCEPKDDRRYETAHKE